MSYLLLTLTSTDNGPATIIRRRYDKAGYQVPGVKPPRLVVESRRASEVAGVQLQVDDRGARGSLSYLLL
jgi:hypothetical protein